MSRDFVTIRGSGHPPAGLDDLSHVVRRIRTIVASAVADRHSREEVDIALQRFEALERTRHQRRLLDQARGMKRSIATILELLRDIDELDGQNMDFGVLAEASLLFKDIAEAAESGSRALQRISPRERAGRRK